MLLLLVPRAGVVELRATPEFALSVAARDRLAESVARNIAAYAAARTYGGQA